MDPTHDDWGDVVQRSEAAFDNTQVYLLIRDGETSKTQVSVCGCVVGETAGGCVIGVTVGDCVVGVSVGECVVGHSLGTGVEGSGVEGTGVVGSPGAASATIVGVGAGVGRKRFGFRRR